MAMFWTRLLLGLTMFGAVVALPTWYYRAQYAHSKRLRPVEEGKLYRCGMLTSEGFDEALERYRIRTVINLRDEAPDPRLSNGERESAFVERRGVRYVHIALDLHDPRQEPTPEPKAIQRFREIMDDPENHPVLLHCQAGLHRTGIFTAIYRMEYNGWPLRRAFAEMEQNGFQHYAAHSGNLYIRQYLLNYRPRGQARTDGPISIRRAESTGADRE